MNKFTLSPQEQAVFDGLAAAMRQLPEASQYKVLGRLAHEMDRDVVRKGALRAAAAVAGSTARAVVEGNSLKKTSSKSSKKGSPKGYPPAFTESPQGRALLAAQADAKRQLTNPPTEGEKAALRAASEAVRDGFRRFKEATCNN